VWFVFEKGKEVKREPRRRKTGEEGGKTEYIIRIGESLFHPTKEDSKQWYTDNNKKNYWGFAYPSWIGVPITLGKEDEKKVLGVIASYHPEKEWLYSKGDIKILQAIAESAAIALQNAEKYSKSEQLAFLGLQASSIGHIIGNKGGDIRLSIEELKKYFNEIEFFDDWTSKKIEKISQSNQYLLDLSNYLFKPIKAIKTECNKLKLIKLLNDSLSVFGNFHDISIKYNYPYENIYILGNIYLIEVFEEILNNAKRAMVNSSEKVLNIDIVKREEKVFVVFKDTGKGISQKKRKKLFELHYDKDEPDYYGYKSFGLWWVKSFLNYIKGDIEYRPNHPNGSVFIISFPVLKK
ncbi:MAG: sensor histidine kinase, partial [Candidatus Electrothrix sp. AUS1_2]|nr:sensor histidine kinase [Candidatus Electrothrix sp. AUS1_2]